MRKIMVIVWCLLIISSTIAQERKEPVRSGWKRKERVGKKISIRNLKPIRIDPRKFQRKGKLLPELDEPESFIDAALQRKLKLKAESKLKGFRSSIKGNDRFPENEVMPKEGIIVLDTSAGRPPDNSIAISNGGNIVAADNRRIYFYKDDLSQVDALTIGDFFEGWINVDNGTSDPKLIYDPHADRFIFMIQSGNRANESKIIVCFSTSNNPAADGWIAYTFNEYTQDSLWFDYPSIAVNDKEVYITGNLFTNGRDFGGNVIYQLKKNQGYNGAELTGLMWRDINTPNSSKASSIFAVPYGRGGTYGPGIYLIDNEGGSGNAVFLYDITNYIEDDPAIDKYTVDLASFEPAPFAFQKDTPTRLDLGDNRIRGGFYLNGRIHFVFAKDRGDLWSGISYTRFRVSTLTAQSKLFHRDRTDYCYPNIASTSRSVSNKSVFIAFLRSNSEKFPQIRMKRYFNDQSSNNSFPIKTGVSFFDPDDDGAIENERWGDYVGIQRKYNSRSVWVMGHIPNDDNRWVSYIHKVEI